MTKRKICPQLSPANGKNYYRGSNLALCFHALEDISARPHRLFTFVDLSF